jgi:D-alanine-D-alanine ligase
MDKEVMKRLLRDAGIANADFKVFQKGLFDSTQARETLSELGAPVFVKPANLGSSVGIRKVGTVDELVEACEYAFEFDTKIIVETGIEGREIECAVLGNRDPKASLVGEVISSQEHGFYSYDAKYIDSDGATLVIPCELEADTLARVQSLAVRSYQVLCCQGLARVDMFLQSNGELLVNEINTIPGFTNISMYPKLWEKTGIGNSELVTRLIELAKERRTQAQALRTSLA